MNLDQIYVQIGENGPQQIKFGAALFLLKVYSPFIVLQYTFVTRQVDFTCHRPNEPPLKNSCPSNMVAGCSNITFSSDDTILSEWTLVCDRNWLAKSTMSALMFGFLLGALVLGNLSDKIGRKANLVLTLSGCLLFNLVSGLTGSYSYYITARFLVGFCISGNILSVIVLISELVGASYRGLYGVTVMGAFPVGIVFLAFTAFHLQHWRHLTIFASILGTPFLLYHWYLVESPRWLLSTNRITEARESLLRIAQGNRAKSSLSFSLKGAPSGELEIRETLCAVFSRRRLLQVICILSYSWFVSGASYYGLTLASGHIGSDLYSGFALSGLVELPAVVGVYLVIQHIGRRQGLAFSMFLSGIFCLSIKLAEGGSIQYFDTFLALMGKMCIAASFKAAYIISGEIFATSVRNSGVGFLSCIARIGSILAPFIVMAGEFIPGIQFSIFGLLGLTGGFFSLWLPETKGKPLPETVSEMLIDKSRKINLQHL